MSDKLVINANLLARPITKAQSNEIAEKLNSATKNGDHPFLHDDISRAYSIKIMYPTHSIIVPIFGTAQQAINKAHALRKELMIYSTSAFIIKFNEEVIYQESPEDRAVRRLIYVAEIKTTRLFRKPHYRRVVYTIENKPKLKSNQELIHIKEFSIVCYSKFGDAVMGFTDLLDNLILTKDLSNGKYSAKANS